MPPTGLSILAAVIGASVASFGNTFALRLQRSEGIGGRSKCPSCRRVLGWYDLIPVVSYLALAGRCRSCRWHIPFRYLWMELIGAALFVAALAFSPGNLPLALVTGLLLFTLVLTSLIDLRSQQIPDVLSATVFLAGTVSAVVRGMIPSSVLGLLVALAWFGSQWVASRGRYVGSGDIFFACALAMWLGLSRTIVMLLLSYILGAVVALLLLASGRLHLRGSRIAFAPLLSLAAVLAFLGIGDAYTVLLTR